MAIVQVSLNPYNKGKRAVLKISSSTYVKLQSLGVAVRKNGVEMDFPGAVKNVTVGPEGYTYVSDPRALTPGTYVVYGSYKLKDKWYSLPRSTVTVGDQAPEVPDEPPQNPPPKPPPASPDTPSGPIVGKSKVFDEQFTSLNTRRWTNARTSAYPGKTNPGDNKLDYLNPGSSVVSGGRLVQTATKRSDGNWNTGLLTTEYSSEDFEVRTGDYIEGRFQFNGELGQWPAFWTWGSGSNNADMVRGHGELDMFEYHSDNENLLEFGNHAGSGGDYYRNDAVRPGHWFTLGVHVQASKLTWYLNGDSIYSGGSMPSNWHANLIICQSVSRGRWHPAPNHSRPMPFYTDYITVWR